MRRELEDSITTDLGGRLTYAGYLDLERLLAAQHPLSEPEHHDELLFIVQHQTSELWMKLVIHELRAAIEHLRADEAGRAQKVLARVKQVQRQLFEQWAVLETLTPSEYAQFRGVLKAASGFQSAQYREIEWTLGSNRNADMLRVFAHDPATREHLRGVLETPSLYDEFLRHLARAGHAIPPGLIERDWTQPHVRTPELVPALTAIYRQPERHWAEYALCEQLVDVEESFALWRFRHLKTVERIIGFKPGTGGSSGAAFLRRAVDLEVFPELLDVRSALGG